MKEGLIVLLSVLALVIAVGCFVVGYLLGSYLEYKSWQEWLRRKRE